MDAQTDTFTDTESCPWTAKFWSGNAPSAKRFLIRNTRAEAVFDFLLESAGKDKVPGLILVRSGVEGAESRA
jgi:hypothetical protein